MTDYNQLDRLAELRRNGALSDEEFEREKARILAAAREAGSPAANLSKPRTSLWRGVSIVIAVLLVTGVAAYVYTRQSGTAPSLADSAVAGATQLLASTSDWTVTSSVDPMTDIPVDEAVALLSGERLNIETAIICKAGTATYRFRLFDKAGEPAELPVNYGRVAFKLRFDQNPAQGLTHRPEYSNQITAVDEIGEIIRAQQVIAQFATSSGEETVRIDQSDAGLRPILDKCAQAMAEKQARDEQKRQDYANAHPCGEMPCPTGSQPPLLSNGQPFPLRAPDQAELDAQQAIDRAMDEAEANAVE